MAHKVLAVGYNRNEYEIICPKLLKKNVEIDFLKQHKRLNVY